LIRPGKFGGCHVRDKKARTRRLIADTAARLFAERGYERVAVSDVAHAAEVAEQTVYNYFPTRERLVIDREEQVQDRLCDLIRSRPPGVTPAAAIRSFVLEAVAGLTRKLDLSRAGGSGLCRRLPCAGRRPDGMGG
jgi:AcrR family transcriptional regulator